MALYRQVPRKDERLKKWTLTLPVAIAYGAQSHSNPTRYKFGTDAFSVYVTFVQNTNNAIDVYYNYVPDNGSSMSDFTKSYVLTDTAYPSGSSISMVNKYSGAVLYNGSRNLSTITYSSSLPTSYNFDLFARTVYTIDESGRFKTANYRVYRSTTSTMEEGSVNASSSLFARVVLDFENTSIVSVPSSYATNLNLGKSGAYYQIRSTIDLTSATFTSTYL